jgi:3-hydroxymyristoyl/3-hydroxydecanoyl-(acyl carrier protein) dehydratase
MLYHYANIKLESAILVAATVFMVDLILFYDAFIKFLKAKFHLNINSMFLEGHGHGH